MGEESPTAIRYGVAKITAAGCDDAVNALPLNARRLAKRLERESGAIDHTDAPLMQLIERVNRGARELGRPAILLVTPQKITLQATGVNQWAELASVRDWADWRELAAEALFALADEAASQLATGRQASSETEIGMARIAEEQAYLTELRSAMAEAYFWTDRAAAQSSKLDELRLRLGEPLDADLERSFAETYGEAVASGNWPAQLWQARKTLKAAEEARSRVLAVLARWPVGRSVPASAPLDEQFPATARRALLRAKAAFPRSDSPHNLTSTAEALAASNELLSLQDDVLAREHEPGARGTSVGLAYSRPDAEAATIATRHLAPVSESASIQNGEKPQSLPTWDRETRTLTGPRGAHVVRKNATAEIRLLEVIAKVGWGRVAPYPRDEDPMHVRKTADRLTQKTQRIGLEFRADGRGTGIVCEVSRELS